MSNAANNLALWDSLKTTDPKATKTFQRAGGFSGTAIRPMWAVWRATKEFGPVGQGWGWTEHEHVVQDGMIFCRVSVWYVKDNQRYETGSQWGGTPIATKRKDGSVHTDDESFKKSTTDGITKCLSYIGIGADVHMGQFDDSKYVEEAAKVTAAVAKDDGAEKARLWVDGKIAEMTTCTTLAALQEMHSKGNAKLADIKSQHGGQFDRYTAELNAHKARLTPKTQAAE